MRLRQCEIVTDADKLAVDIQQTCMNYKTIKQWAYILHDKDDTRPHYHIYLNFGNSSCDTDLVASWFKLAPNFVNKVKGRKSDMLLYLTHGNESQKNKHQYNPNEVVANFDFQVEIQQSKIIGNFDEYSYARQLQYVDSLPIDEKTKAFNKLERLWRLRCQTMTLHADRNVKVVFITGKAGAGKTYYARRLLDGLGKDYCVSSSSNDPFQDYLGQDAIILDDMRDTSFELADFLKILDNNTSSSVRSRFCNKVFNGSMIVVTSSVPLYKWYPQNQYNSSDSLDQLYRRISCYVEVEKDVIKVYAELSKSGMPVGYYTKYKNELADIKPTMPDDFSALSLFDCISQPIDEPPIFQQKPSTTVQTSVFDNSEGDDEGELPF